MIGIIDYYQAPPRDYRKRHDVGQFFLAPVPFQLHGKILHLRAHYVSREKPEESEYTIEATEFDAFDPTGQTPIYELKLPSDAFVIPNPHKLRPVIILSEAIPDWADYQRKREDYYLVAPLYSAKDTAGNYKYSEAFLHRIQAYEYPNLFYLPESDEFGVHESIVRLDRVLFTHADFLRPQPTQLTDDAIFCLTRWLHHFVGAELEEVLKLYRDEALQTLQS